MKFSTKQTVVTAGINNMMTENVAFAQFVHLSLRRHFGCDWGDLNTVDKQTNDYALATNERIFSVYASKLLDKSIWIISEADRITTTVLFSVEY